MTLFATLEKMIVLLFAIAMGYAANKLGYLNEDTNRRLTKLVLNILLPCMILASVMTGSALPENRVIFSVLKMAVVFYGLEFVFMLVLPKFLGGTVKQKGVWKYACMFSNTAFIGYPVIEALLGNTAVFYGVILVLPYNVLTYTLGPVLLGGEARFHWSVLRTPTMIASLASLILALSRVPTPALAGQVLDFVGDAAIPLSLLVLGSVLAGMKVKHVLLMPRMWIFSAFRLLIMPFVLLLLLRPMALDPVVLGVGVMEMAMPVAVNGVMLSMEYDGDTESMAQTIFFTTILSMVTIPVAALLL